MRSPMVRWLVAVLALTASTEAVARRRRPSTPPPRAPVETPFADPRLPATRLRPPDDGIIHWNTPNKDGNLGGPGTGGGGGGGG
jgi:hypothetical protein